MKKLLTLAITLIGLFMSQGASATLYGSFTVCVGGTSTLNDSVGAVISTGGTWSSSNVAVASVGSSTGIVTGHVAGVANITYIGTSGIFSHGFTVNPIPAAIGGGTAPFCMTTTITLTNSVSGGMWISPSPAIATVSAAGVVTGMTAGTVLISYIIGTGCYATKEVTVALTTPDAITGAHITCEGTSTPLSATVSGGTWVSSAPAVATVSGTGVVSGTVAGATIITHTTSAACGIITAIHTFTVWPAPPPIGGGTTPLCTGSTLTLTDAAAGGTWTTSSAGTATIGAVTGIATGISAGTATISYILASGCAASTVVSVIATTTDAITGTLTVCTGSTTALTSSAGGSLWGSSATGIATVSSTGVVSGIAAGTAIITHNASGACPGAPASVTVTVSGIVSAGTLSGTTSVAAGSTTTLSSTVSGGVWGSGSTSIATVDPITGVVTGVAPGVSLLSYTVTGCGGPVFDTTSVTVTAAPDCISGDVQFTSAPYFGNVKVWLIKYDATTHILSAIDSTTITASGATASYSFCGMGTDSFRVKAACDTVYSAIGYLPTYHTASAYWYSAAVIWHTTGTSDINKHITMASGTPTSGAGFVAGDVTTGANKGTAGAPPATGMLIYCVNASTGAILQHTKTNMSGQYSFSNLPVGEPLKIYPEHINYATTPFMVTLTSGAPSMTAANFEQHTISMTITPKTANVINTPVANTTAAIYPNPASSSLNVQWTAGTGTGSITIADIAGRMVLSTAVDMATGSTVINLDGISKGLYIVTVKGQGVNHNNKIEIQ